MNDQEFLKQCSDLNKIVDKVEETIYNGASRDIKLCIIFGKLTNPDVCKRHELSEEWNNLLDMSDK